MNIYRRYARLSPSKQKRAFDSLMVKGWKGKGYIEGMREDSEGTSHCALGAVEAALGIDSRMDEAENYFSLLRRNAHTIVEASNLAGNKEDAIKAVKAIKWRRSA